MARRRLVVVFTFDYKDIINRVLYVEFIYYFFIFDIILDPFSRRARAMHLVKERRVEHEKFRRLIMT